MAASDRSAEECDVSSRDGLAKRVRRDRGPLLQILRRCVQAAVVALLMTILFWGIRLVRLHSAVAPARVDFVGQLDAARALVPVQDRAWPFYREAILKLTEFPLSGDRGNMLSDGLTAGPSSKHWSEAREYLDRNEEPLTLIVRGAARPEFGFIYRDAANDPWLRRSGYKLVEEKFSTDRPSWNVGLPQVQDSNSVQRLLCGAVHRAVAAENGPQATDFLEAELRLADQLMRSAEFSIIETAATRLFRTGAETSFRYVSDRPGLFTTDDVERLRAAVAAFGRGRIRPRLELTRQMILESLESLYSDDGSGNGRLTARGVADLRELLAGASVVPPEIAPWKDWLEADKRSSRLPRWWLSLQAELAGSSLASIVADRRETLSAAGKLMDLLEQDMARPAGSKAPSAMDAELARWTASPELRQKFVPVLVILPTFVRIVEWANLPQTTVVRDTALIAMALELHHRRYGMHPERLEALVPEFLAEVPLDPNDGQPIRYLLRDRRPLVYSVSFDGTDDTARESAWKNEPVAAAKDQQWLPVLDPKAQSEKP